MLLHFLQWKPDATICIHFLSETVVLFTIKPVCNCEMIPNHVTFSLKYP